MSHSGSQSLSDAINIDDLELLARERLPKMAYDYYASGAHDELTLSDNRAAYRRLALRYRVLAGVAERDTSTTVLGESVSMPLMVAPTAFHKMAHPDGELATVRAAGAHGTIMILSTLSTTKVEEVVAAASGPVWFQLYVYKDRGATEALVKRAAAAGCRALVLTVDAPLLGTRERDVRNRFGLPDGLSVENLLPAGMSELKAAHADSGLAAYVKELLDPALSFRDVEWLASLSDLPVIVKGVVRDDDARRAVDHGASAIVVSNHGGRQLDTAPATIDVLEEVATAVGDDVEIFVDGGVRRGTDVLKAVALGARAVLVGRPVLWGLAVGGQAGVEHALDLLRRELDLAMALCGCSTVSEITGDLIHRAR
jgi:4-hydroxymandelate oxidase